jgi:hypothetical protein
MDKVEWDKIEWDEGCRTLLRAARGISGELGHHEIICPLHLLLALFLHFPAWQLDGPPRDDQPDPIGDDEYEVPGPLAPACTSLRQPAPNLAGTAGPTRVQLTPGGRLRYLKRKTVETRSCLW